MFLFVCLSGFNFCPDQAKCEFCASIKQKIYSRRVFKAKKKKKVVSFFLECVSMLISCLFIIS